MCVFNASLSHVQRSLWGLLWASLRGPLVVALRWLFSGTASLRGSLWASLGGSLWGHLSLPPQTSCSPHLPTPLAFPSPNSPLARAALCLLPKSLPVSPPPLPPPWRHGKITYPQTPENCNKKCRRISAGFCRRIFRRISAGFFSPLRWHQSKAVPKPQKRL